MNLDLNINTNPENSITRSVATTRVRHIDLLILKKNKF